MTIEPTDRNEVRAAIEVLLSSKHTTLFLTWDISHPDGLDQAVEYLTDLWLDIEAQMDAQFPLNGLEAAFVAGVTESMDVAAERPTGPSPHPLVARAESMRRHPSFQVVVPDDQVRRDIEAKHGWSGGPKFDSFDLRPYTGDSIPSGQ